MQTTTHPPGKVQTSARQRIDGVAIGVLVGMNSYGEPLVLYPSNLAETALKAKTTTVLDAKDIGKEVALVFEQGDPAKPVIIGRIQQPGNAPGNDAADQDTEVVQTEIDGEHITLTGKQSITLKCGKASITLTKAGKVLVRGAYLLNRSSGVNRIKGGSVQIN